MRYAEKLKDPRWQKKRLEILERDGWACQGCYGTEGTLHVHHRRYLPNRDPWDYPNNLLVTLCEECHEAEKIGWQENLDLLEILKEHFLASHVQQITGALINNFKTRHVPEVHASAIAWFLSSTKEQAALLERYMNHLHTRGSNESKEY